MEFEPLRYVLSTVTWWHVPAAAALVVLNMRNRGKISLTKIVLALLAIVIGYALFAPTFGQVFGDRYDFVDVWPTALVLGASAATIFYAFIAANDDSRGKLGFLVVGWAFHSFFLGLAFCAFLYLLPLMVHQFAFVELPKFFWAVAT